MYRKYLLIFATILVSIVSIAQSRKDILFDSSDNELKETFDWAKSMALSFSHDGSDAVGYWYESALPNREAFCMRDISHQCLGAEILGLSNHNYNMMYRFAENISEAKDWCTYWEINRYNKPAPADYVSDIQFWYNLPANFDVLQACLKLYDWTGNKQYLYNPVLVNFYEKTLDQYITRWKLEPNDLFIRPRLLNTELPISEKMQFSGARGIPSYVEDEGGFSVAGDLIASLYAAFKAYSEMLNMKNEPIKALYYKRKAEEYKNIINEKFWNQKEKRYEFFWSCVNGDFSNVETPGITYFLWFNAISTPERSRLTINRLLQMKCNVENQSHYPTLFYRYHMPEEAYNNMMSLKKSVRNNYPEVSYGVVEGLIGGLMGIHPIASDGVIETLPQLTTKTEWAKISDLKVFNSYICVKHESMKRTIFTNHGDKALVWRAAFWGERQFIYLNAKQIKSKYCEDIMGNDILI